MRQDRTVQASLFDIFAKHEIGCELKKASQCLDQNPALIGMGARKLNRLYHIEEEEKRTDRQGTSCPRAVPACTSANAAISRNLDIVFPPPRGRRRAGPHGCTGIGSN